MIQSIHESVQAVALNEQIPPNLPEVTISPVDELIEQKAAEILKESQAVEPPSAMPLNVQELSNQPEAIQTENVPQEEAHIQLESVPLASAQVQSEPAENSQPSAQQTVIDTPPAEEVVAVETSAVQAAEQQPSEEMLQAVQERDAAYDLLEKLMEQFEGNLARLPEDAEAFQPLQQLNKQLGLLRKEIPTNIKEFAARVNQTCEELLKQFAQIQAERAKKSL
jgi:hypothetical protein